MGISIHTKFRTIAEAELLALKPYHNDILRHERNVLGSVWMKPKLALPINFSCAWLLATIYIETNFGSSTPTLGVALYDSRAKLRRANRRPTI
jgi:hypothetical protein